MADNENKKEKNNGNKILMIIIIILMILILGLLVFIVLRPSTTMVSKAPRKDPTAMVGELKDKTEEEIIAELNKVVESGMFDVSINTVISFDNGSSEGEMRIQNPEGNNFCTMVRIYLKDTEETVYQTGVIERNRYIEKAKLDVPLEKGVYDAVAEFTALDPETLSEQGKTNVEITLNVKS